jgi:hypothetical protein
MSSISIVTLNVLEKELKILKDRKERVSISVLSPHRGGDTDVVVDYFERRIEELNEYND